MKVTLPKTIWKSKNPTDSRGRVKNFDCKCINALDISMPNHAVHSASSLMIWLAWLARETVCYNLKARRVRANGISLVPQSNATRQSTVDCLPQWPTRGALGSPYSPYSS